MVPSQRFHLPPTVLSQYHLSEILDDVHMVANNSTAIATWWNTDRANTEAGRMYIRGLQTTDLACLMLSVRFAPQYTPFGREIQRTMRH